MALNLFGNNNYKVPEILETDNDRLRAVNYQLIECSGSQSTSMETLKESLISWSHKRDLKSSPEPDHRVAELQRILNAWSSQVSMANSEWDPDTWKRDV